MEMVRYEDQYDDTEIPADNDYKNNDDVDENDCDNKNEPPHSLLTLLDDKNKFINLLKTQIHNQKLQLGFYLHRVLTSPKIVELSESCVPHETEENIQINLAMNKFWKQTGLKSRIMTLHGRMVDLEKRILRISSQQEEMVFSIMNKVAALLQNGINVKSDGIEFCLTQLKDDRHMQALAKVLHSTNKLRKELDAFRTCSNRLIVIEDERNSLVDQVYAMPVTKRMSYDVLLASQYEKLRLEQEVQEIKQAQKTLHERLAYFTQAKPCESSSVEDSSPEEQATVQKMLAAVNTDAVNLLLMAKEQKDKYLAEISQLREDNSSLSQQVASLQQSAADKHELETRISAAINEFDKVKEYNRVQCHHLKVKLETVVEERDLLHRNLQHYCNIDEQVKCLRMQVDDMDTIRRQRDYYKAQVNDLQAIRSAYTQLVDHPPGNIKKEEIKKIEELENQRNELTGKIETMTEVVGNHELQIKDLLIVIQKLATHKESQPFQANIVNISRFSQTDKHMSTNATINYSSGSISVCSQTEHSQESPKLTTDQATLCDLEYPPSDGISQIAKTEDEEISHYLAKKSILNHTQPINVQTPLISTTTSVEVKSVNQEGKSESLKAVVECNSPIEGVIQINNSSALSLRLTCGASAAMNKMHANAPLPPIITEREIVHQCDQQTRMKFAPAATDEFELMKDSSNETMVVTLPSLHRHKASLLKMQRVEYTCSADEAVWSKAENTFIGILPEDDEDVNVIISRQTIPSEMASDDNESDRENQIENDADGDVQNVEENRDVEENVCTESYEFDSVVKTKPFNVNDLTSRLRQITDNLDQTLSRPDGKHVVLRTIKGMYGAFLHPEFATLNN